VVFQTNAVDRRYQISSYSWCISLRANKVQNYAFTVDLVFHPNRVTLIFPFPLCHVSFPLHFYSLPCHSYTPPPPPIISLFSPPSHTPICNMLSFFYGNSPAIQENTRLKPHYACSYFADFLPSSNSRIFDTQHWRVFNRVLTRISSLFCSFPTY
jgi:hypothetical protein